MKKIILAVAVVAVLVIGGVAAFLLTRDDAPEAFSEDTTGETTVGTTPDSVDGAWIVDADGTTEVGFRILEDIAGLSDHVAVGRTPSVEGSITIDGTQVTEGGITADLTALEFTDDPGLSVGNRTNALQRQGLEIATFPDATFTLTEAIELGEVPTDGTPVTATATGDLTLRDVTQSVTFEVTASVQGARIRVNSTAPVTIALADFGIEKPTGPPGLSIADEGTFEFLVFFTQA